MTRPPPDPRQHGFRLGWLSRAQLWSNAARRLISTTNFADVQLGFVALYLCVRCAALLIDGNDSGSIPADLTARDDCPILPKALHKLRDRLEKMRDEILHLSDRTEEGREIGMSWSTDAPDLTFRSTVGSHVIAKDEMTRPEVEAILDKLDPWLRLHLDRLLAEGEATA